jgi:hypothetical protein
MYIGRHVKYHYSWHNLMQLEFSRQNIEKSPDVKFHENLAELFRAYGRAGGRADRRVEANSRSR